MDSFIDTPTSYLSPHVRNIATLVYSEFERLVSKYGEGVVDGIVPIMIRTLEKVDQLHENNEILQTTNNQIEQELHSLTSRLEKEIKARRATEEKVMAVEDETAELRIQMNKKLTDCTKLVRILEAKLDAANEQIARQEVREAELRRDLTNAQNRCNELISSHVAHVERSRNRQSGTLGRPSTSPRVIPFAPEERMGDIEETRCKNFNLEILEESRVHQPVTSSSSPPMSRTLEEDLFDTLDETTDYERYLNNEPMSTRVMSDESDDISRVSEDCEFIHCESLEAEVRKLVAENQDLTEIKNALNILKDDLLSRIDDLSGDNIILENNLVACREMLAAERVLARQRERQLNQRIQELTSRLWVAEKLLENARTGAIVRCVSERQLHNSSLDTAAYTATLRRRTQSSEAIFTAASRASTPVESEKKKHSEHNQCSSKLTIDKPSGNSGSSNSNSTTRGGGILRLTKRQIARIILERNCYKEHYLEARDQLRAIEIEARTQAETPLHLRKRDMAHALLSGLVESVRNFADGVKNDIGEFIGATSSEHSAYSPPPSSSSTSTALWNILGNFVGQAVTYTADAVIGTGNDLPLDVSRPMIAARVNSKLSIKSDTNGPNGTPTTKNHPMYTDH